MSADMPHNEVPQARAVIRKLDRHVLPLLFLLGVVSIIDRSNVGVASLQMNQDLGLSATAFGLGAGIFFFGYFIFEIPSNLILHKVGARRWIARIAITWGLLAAAMALVQGETSFYILRFLLGLAEAGFFPGVYLYLSYWYPRQSQGRAPALFLVCIPVAIIISSPLGGWLVSFDSVLGMAGWRFLFIVEAIPALILGVLIYRRLADTPRDATWLTGDERNWLHAQLDSERAQKGQSGHANLAVAFRSGRVWVFTLMYFCYAMGGYGLIFFLPQVIDGFGTLSPTVVGLLTAVPYAAAALAMVPVARHSDRTGERRWHFGGCMLLSAICLLGTGLTLNIPALAMTFLTLTGAASLSALGTFWSRPTQVLTGIAAAAGFAIINSLGNIGGFVGPYAIGALRTATGSFYLPMLLLAAVFAIGGLASIALRDPAPRVPEITEPTR